MPKAWSDKDERQYEDIKRSLRARGRSTARAKEIAARTVNKRRRREGRAKSPTSRATGNPRTSLEERSRRELYNRARELDIVGRSAMTKDALIRAIRARG